MEWLFRNKGIERAKWHKWFAWYPVCVYRNPNRDKKYVWLKIIEVRDDGVAKSWRLIGSPVHYFECYCGAAPGC